MKNFIIKNNKMHFLKVALVTAVATSILALLQHIYNNVRIGKYKIEILNGKKHIVYSGIAEDPAHWSGKPRLRKYQKEGLTHWQTDEEIEKTFKNVRKDC